MTTFPVTRRRERLGQRYLEFAFQVHGAQVACYVSEPAIERWRRDLCCERENVHRLSRIAHEIVAEALHAATVTAGEHWIARIGDDSIALTLADE